MKFVYTLGKQVESYLMEMSLGKHEEVTSTGERKIKPQLGKSRSCSLPTIRRIEHSKI